MGKGPTFDSGAAAARANLRASQGSTGMAHDAAVRTGRITTALHPSLDFTKKPLRECRDNEDSPLSVPIAVMIDVTGSMSTLPAAFLANLHKVIGVIKDKGNVPYPALCTLAIGDVDSDRVPIQVGEFEGNDVLVEQHLTNIYCEGNGGGNNKESYDLGAWVFANRVVTDHWEKRGHKGFLFIIGDENFALKTRGEDISRYLGIENEEDVSIETTFKKLQEKWEVFILRPGGTGHFDDTSITSRWRTLVPHERVVEVEDRNNINSIIAGIVSVMTGTSVAATIDNLKSSGLSGDVTTHLASITSDNPLAIAFSTGNGNTSIDL